MKLNKKIKAFTLVELIVVVTILSILSTIGFVSYSGYLAGVRDTNRVSQLKAIGDALHLYTTKSSLPRPDSKVDVMSGSTLIAYQGDIGKDVIETIGYTSDGKDPKDDTYFSYYLTQDRKHFQLMAFLEEDPELSYKPHPNPLLLGEGIVQAIDYTTRHPHVEGKKLGILTDDKNTPIQKIESIKTDTKLDITTTTDTYKSYLKTNEVLKGDNTVLKDLGKIAKVGGRGYTASGNILSYKDLDIDLIEGFINNGCGNDTILDGRTGLCWWKVLSSRILPSNFVSTCNNSSIGGNNDWRVPKLSEIVQLNSTSKADLIAEGFTLGDTYFGSMESHSASIVTNKTFDGGTTSFPVTQTSYTPILCVRNI